MEARHTRACTAAHTHKQKHICTHSCMPTQDTQLYLVKILVGDIQERLDFVLDNRQPLSLREAIMIKEAISTYS